MTDRSQVLAPSTVRLLVGHMSAIYTAAVLDRLVAVSPVQRIKLPDATQERIVPLTVDQVEALADAVEPRCRAMIVVQAGLGLRAGELLGLRVQDVNFLGRTVRIEYQRDRLTEQLVPPEDPTLSTDDPSASGRSRHSGIPPGPVRASGGRRDLQNGGRQALQAQPLPPKRSLNRL